MKTRSRFWYCLLSVMVLSAGDCILCGTPAQNLLADPGFESGAPVASDMGGWGELNGSIFSQDYAHSGLWSLADHYNSSSIVVAGLQFVPATAGSVYELSGWGFTPATLNGGQGFLLVDFLDSSQHLINSGGTAFYSIGLLDASTPAQTWTFLSGSVTAPAGTSYLEVAAELFNGSPGNVVYYDDLSLTLVPEPSAAIVLSAALGFLLIRRIHHWHVGERRSRRSFASIRG